MSRADLVVIPTKGSDLDAAEAVKAIKFIRFQEKIYRRQSHSAFCSHRHGQQSGQERR